MKKTRFFVEVYQEGGAEAVLQIVRRDPAWLNALDPWGLRPLHRAVEYPEMVSLLIAQGADLDGLDQDGRTALYRALEYKYVESACLLLAAGADPDACDQRGNSPLVLAIQGGCSCVTQLLQAGADPNRMTESGRLPLFEAIRKSDIELVRQLLSSGADATRRNNQGQTVLHQAAYRAMDGPFTRQLIELLLQAGADGEVRDHEGNTFMHVAAGMEWEEPLLAFLDPPLRGRVDVRNQAGETPLHKLVPSRSEPARMLLAAGAEVNARDNQGNPPLIKVVKAWSSDAAQVLVEHGADVNASNHEGTTALHVAARQGSEDNVTLLLKAGANPNALNAHGERPADLAFSNHTVLSMLEQATGVKIRRLHLGFVIEGKRRNQARSLWAHLQTPLLYLKGKLGLRGDKVLSYEKEKRNWAFTDYHEFDDGDTALAMANHVNPYFDRIQPADFDDLIVIGRWFAFVKKQALEKQRDFLQWLGIDRAPLILPRLGVDREGRSALDLRLDPFALKAPEWNSLAVVSTTRPVYAAGQEAVAVVLCLHPDGSRPGQGEVCLYQDKVEVPKTRQRLKLRNGLALARWKSLPEGRYTLELSWQGNVTLTSFQVGAHTLSLARAEWVEGPWLRDEHWKGRARLWLRDHPLPPGIEVMLGSGRGQTGEDGLIEVDVPADEVSPPSLRVAWQDDQEHSALLPLAGQQSLQAGGLRLSTAASGQESVCVSGLHLSRLPTEKAPVRLLSPLGDVARWEVLRDVEAVAITKVLPNQSPQTLTMAGLRQGQRIEIDLSKAPGTFAFLCLGALCQGEVYETMIPWTRASHLALECPPKTEVNTGERVKIRARLTGNPSSVCVVVEDARLTQELQREAPCRRLDDLCRIARALEGDPPPLFSEAWLDGTFRARRVPSTFRPLSSRGHMLVDMLPSDPPEEEPGKPAVRHISRPDESQESPPSPTLMAELVRVRGEFVEVNFSAPAHPGTLAVHILAVDALRSCWVYAQGEVAVKAPLEIWTDAVPQLLLPEDAGRVRGRLYLVCRGGPLQLEASLDGQPISLEGTEGERSFPLHTGLYQVRACSKGHEAVRSFRVRPADRLSERVRRLIVLRAGESFRLEDGEALHSVHISDPYEVLSNCGRALRDYPFFCCEQTGAAMLGAGALLWAGRGQQDLQAWSAISQGLHRLDQLWRGDGYAFYSGAAEAEEWGSRLAYRHLRALQSLCGGLEEKVLVSPVVEHLERTVRRCERALGNLFEGPIQDCYQAWLAPSDRFQEGLEHVRSRWQVLDGQERGRIEVKSDLVMMRAETCYAAAVLLADQESRQRHLPSIEATINWLGFQMREGGRLYSTPDSSALLVLLMAYIQNVAQGGRLSLDGSPPLDPPEAGRLMQTRMPREITCLEGRIPLIVDAHRETQVELQETDAFRVHFEVEGRPVEEAALGTEVELVLQVSEYRPGLLAHLALPPCLALEERGARLQSVQRDLVGHNSLRLRLRAIQRSDGAAWHGMAAVLNMFREEDRWGQRLSFRVV